MLHTALKFKNLISKIVILEYYWIKKTVKPKEQRSQRSHRSLKANISEPQVAENKKAGGRR